MYKLNPEDLASLTKSELLYGTDRFLPVLKDIPDEFFKGNIYTRIVDAMYVGETPPKGEVHIQSGFDAYSEYIFTFLLAHLKCIKPEYDHKIAGVAYMMSVITHVTAILT